MALIKSKFGDDIDFKALSNVEKVLTPQDGSITILLDLYLGHHNRDRMHLKYACNNLNSKAISVTIQAINNLPIKITAKQEMSRNLGHFFVGENLGRNITTYNSSLDDIFILNEVMNQMNKRGPPIDLNCTAVSLRFERICVDTFDSLRKCVDERKEFYIIETLECFTEIVKRWKEVEKEMPYRMKLIKPIKKPFFKAFEETK